MSGRQAELYVPEAEAAARARAAYARGFRWGLFLALAMMVAHDVWKGGA